MKYHKRKASILFSKQYLCISKLNIEIICKMKWGNSRTKKQIFLPPRYGSIIHSNTNILFILLQSFLFLKTFSSSPYIYPLYGECLLSTWCSEWTALFVPNTRWSVGSFFSFQKEKNRHYGTLIENPLLMICANNMLIIEIIHSVYFWFENEKLERKVVYIISFF